jgi:hypothetical protein
MTGRSSCTATKKADETRRVRSQSVGWPLVAAADAGCAAADRCGALGEWCWKRRTRDRGASVSMEGGVAERQQQETNGGGFEGEEQWSRFVRWLSRPFRRSAARIQHDSAQPIAPSTNQLQWLVDNTKEEQNESVEMCMREAKECTHVRGEQCCARGRKNNRIRGSKINPRAPPR